MAIRAKRFISCFRCTITQALRLAYIMTELHQLSAHLESIIYQLNEQQRRQLASKIGQEIRKNQKKRIGKQQNPDGSAYIPRKRLRSRSGKLRGKMFKKLGTAKYLKLSKTPEGVEIGFQDYIGRIARIHQDGLVDSVYTSKGKIRIRYAQRVLLGFTQQDFDLTEEMVFKYIENIL